jgi:uncharacterized protein (DUF1697 family)
MPGMASHSHIALLRGVNVGGRTLVAMAALRDVFVRLGFADVSSVLQSGNLIFSGGGHAGLDLERLLEHEVGRRLGLETSIFVRTAEEWRDVVERNPFPDHAAQDPARLLVMFFKDAPRAEAVETLQAAIAGPEIVRAEGRHLYLVYPAGMGRSRLTNTLIERKLRARGTARNWNTVRRLDALAADR